MTDKPALLLLDPVEPAFDAALTARFDLTRAEGDLEAALAACGGKVRAVVSRGGIPVDAALMDRLPKLEIVAGFGVGYDVIDAVTAAARGIVVTHTPDVVDDEVADLAVALLLAAIRRIPQADAFVRAGHWAKGPMPLSATLRGRRVGLVGMGRIGQAIATRLAGFGVEICYHARHARPGLSPRYFGTLIDLATYCDTLIVVVPGGAETRNLIDAAVLEELGPEGVLVNVARGSVVDEAALVDALERNVILAAGLDVFAAEPEVPAALLARDDVVLLPHIGTSTHHTRAAMGALVLANLESFFERGRTLTPVPESRGLPSA
ncbi:2-hydroxyacid dehydrogenase [Methylobrevis albus]|uniref:2-hydroxyacid dehydrogenase n=1 Tax=Methylobrevis albus TaxID=2793297 RepID=A0A931MXX0_9HYPH|nr:2-hydroxyacid dehydrogenase [Methylobrevis albus]MBH0237742.1 2-hydroxyacid dehydrogenase [Methylobrevis albus]